MPAVHSHTQLEVREFTPKLLILYIDRSVYMDLLVLSFSTMSWDYLSVFYVFLFNLYGASLVVRSLRKMTNSTPTVYITARGKRAGGLSWMASNPGAKSSASGGG